MNLSDPDLSNPKTVNLKALCTLSFESEEFNPKDTFSCDPEEALEHIEKGRAELAEIQAFPPFHILHKLDLELENLDHIGPEWCDGTRLQKFQNEVIAGGSLRSMVEKKRLNWIEGVSNLRKVFPASFKMDEISLGPMLNQIEACWLHKKMHFFEQTVVTKLNDEEMIKRGVVCLKRPLGGMYLDARSRGYDLFQVGQDWAQLYVQLQNVKNKLELALIKCLQTGRVLAVTKNSFDATLVLPSVWDDKPLIYRKDDELVFVFSGNLPETWFHSPETLPAQRSKACRWLERAGKKLNANGVRASQGDYTSIMMRKFGLTKNATKDIWKQSVRIHKGVSGNIPDSIRATKADLLEIEQDN